MAMRSVVTPGNHDGVHLGHRALLDASRRTAESLSARVVALTFDPHPASVLAPERAPEPLTTLSRRGELLRALGADEVDVQRFDQAFAKLSAEDFVRQVLVERLGACAVVIGPDFRFGRGRAGDLSTLRALGAEHGFEAVEVGPVRVGDEVVSSTAVRAAVRSGDVGHAAQLLGRLHDLDGTVVEGDRRGRTIGFPTANLDCGSILRPADGVYAVVMRVEQEILQGVANLGVRPTVAAGRSVEAHLFDFDGDLYGRSVRIGFVQRLREERKMSGLDALKAQIAIDRDRAKEALAAADHGLWRWM